MKGKSLPGWNPEEEELQKAKIPNKSKVVSFLVVAGLIFPIAIKAKV